MNEEMVGLTPSRPVNEGKLGGGAFIGQGIPRKERKKGKMLS
jgi:hypothetical protein